MWPWGHLAVGYLLYSATANAREDGPTSNGTLAVAVGTLLPDLIDKPLAWTVGVLPTGRSFAHSLLFATLLLALVSRLTDRTTSAAFGLGYLSHLLTDLPPETLAGNVEGATYLLWPLLPSPTYELEQSFLAHVVAFSFAPYELLQFALFGAALLVWRRDGRPGSGWVRRVLR